jgi:hypothetical protein
LSVLDRISLFGPPVTAAAFGASVTTCFAPQL